MAKLKDIKGTNIQFLDADPVLYVGTWASAPSLNTGRQELAGAGSSGDNALAFGGDKGGGAPHSDTETEKFNGTAWTEVNDLNQARVNLGGCGTNTAALAIAGSSNPGNTNYVEKWDGTNWTEIAEVNTAKSTNTAAGIITAAISVGGEPSTGNTQVELWNGSSWTETTEVNSAKNAAVTFGTSTATISAAGGGGSTNTELWNGSSWTEVNNLNQAKYSLAGCGLSTAGLVFGGQIPPNTANTESWDGTSWTEVNNLSQATAYQAGSTNAPNTGALNFGGQSSPQTTTEEWAFPPTPVSQLQEGLMWFNSASSALKGYQKASNVPSGTFASGGALNTARYTAGVCGVSTAAICAGGDFYVGPPNSPSDRSGTKTESYNGSTWTEVNDMNNDVQGIFSMAGTQTAGITNAAPNSPKVFIESWDGTSWTNSADLNSGLQERVQAAQGSQTASLIVGGTPPHSTVVEQWDGSSWTEIADINTARSAGRNTGTTSAQIFFGGNSSGSPNGDTKNESWNGTAWTEVGDLPVGRAGHTGLGSQTVAVTTQGNGPNSLGAPNPTGPNSSKALNFWNGTSWSADTDDAPYKARGSSGGGSATDGIICAGISDPNFTLTTTIEWNVDAAVGTISTSQCLTKV